MLACVVYRAELYTVFGPKADIVGQVLGTRLCVDFNLLYLKSPHPALKQPVFWSALPRCILHIVLLLLQYPLVHLQAVLAEMYIKYCNSPNFFEQP